jgi:Zn-dependent M28 family amino/carboxypeptidase
MSGSTPVEVVMVGAQDSYSQKMGELMKARKNALVLINPAHADIFGKYRNYFSKGSTSLATNATEEGSMVFVLHEGELPSSFAVNVTNGVQTSQISNVVGVLPGKKQKEEMVVFSAHYDHIGILKPVDGDSIANGADDDASGTTAVMALAKHFKKQKNNARTLIFVAFTAEEIGGYGSQYFSKQLNPDKVMAMFNIEMIGKPSKFGKNTAWITGYEKSDFGKILQKNLEGSQFTFHADPYPEQDLFYRSDNATLARLGVPAHSISTDEIDIDKLYHSVDDEYESLDIANMTQVILSIAQSAKSIVAGKDTPSRVNAAALK